jgi:hypothetical protein
MWLLYKELILYLSILYIYYKRTNELKIDSQPNILYPPYFLSVRSDLTVGSGLKLSRKLLTSTTFSVADLPSPPFFCTHDETTRPPMPASVSPHPLLQPSGLFKTRCVLLAPQKWEQWWLLQMPTCGFVHFAKRTSKLLELTCSPTSLSRTVNAF